MELPESNNVIEDSEDLREHRKTDRFNDAFVENVPDDNTGWEDDHKDEAGDEECGDQFSDEEENSLLVANQEYLIRFRNAAFTWGMKSDALLEIEDLDIPAGNKRILF